MLDTDNTRQMTDNARCLVCTHLSVYYYVLVLDTMPNTHDCMPDNVRVCHKLLSDELKIYKC